MQEFLGFLIFLLKAALAQDSEQLLAPILAPSPLFPLEFKKNPNSIGQFLSGEQTQEGVIEMFNGGTSIKVWVGYRKPTGDVDALGVSDSGELCPSQSRRDQRREHLPDPRDSCSHRRGAV